MRGALDGNLLPTCSKALSFDPGAVRCPHGQSDQIVKGSVTKRLLGLPVPRTCACKTQGALWPRVAIKRCGQSKVWHAVAGMWTSMGMGAEGCACALLWSFSSLQKVRPIRKTRNQFHGKMRSREPSEPWLESNLFVTLPFAFHPHPPCPRVRRCSQESMLHRHKSRGRSPPWRRVVQWELLRGGITTPQRPQIVSRNGSRNDATLPHF